ncbi:MAG: hypothetical protein ACFCUV_26470 [Rivularia sp. (in: cyanobacteria)]
MDSVNLDLSPDIPLTQLSIQYSSSAEHHYQIGQALRSQHIPIRYSEKEVEAMMAPLQERIAQLEQQLNKQNSSTPFLP